jgi:hypothetical protein
MEGRGGGESKGVADQKINTAIYAGIFDPATHELQSSVHRQRWHH